MAAYRLASAPSLPPKAHLHKHWRGIRLVAAGLTMAGLLPLGLAPSLAAQSRIKQAAGPRDLAAAPVRQSPQTPMPQMVVDENSDTVSFSMEQGMELLDFVKWAQQVTGKRFTFNQTELGSGSPGSQVHFLGTFRVGRDRFQEAFFSFFQTMLYIKGFAIVPRGKADLELLEIVMMAGTRGREISSSARFVASDRLAEYRYQAGVPIQTSVELKHINAQLANNALRPFFATSGQAAGALQIASVGNTSGLILQGLGPQVHAAVQLLQVVDRPAKAKKAAAGKKEQDKPTVLLVKLEHTDALKIEQAVRGALGNGQPVDTAPAEPIEFDDDDAKIEFSMKQEGGMELLDFIKWGQQVTGKRFTYHPFEIAAGSGPNSKIQLLGKLQVDRNRFQEDFFSFFQTMLYTKGFALVPRGEGDLELFDIVMMTGMRGREVSGGARFVAQKDLADYRHQVGVPVLTSIELQNISAPIANNALRPFFASTGGANAGGSIQIGNIGNQTSLLLRGFGPQVCAAAQLLKLVDRPAGPSGVVVTAAPTGDSQAVVLSGSKKQVLEALDQIAKLDVPGKKPSRSTFRDTDGDGLPDTLVPNFEQPKKGAAAGKKDRKLSKPGRPGKPGGKSKSRVY